MDSKPAGFLATPTTVNKIRLFGNHMFASLLSQFLEDKKMIEWRDVAFIYIEALARQVALKHGEGPGAIYFADDLTYKKTHLAYFGMLAINQDTFQTMICQVDEIVKKGPGYIYEYYINIHHSEDSSFTSFTPEEEGLKNHPVVPGTIVYFWRVPSQQSYS